MTQTKHKIQPRLLPENCLFFIKRWSRNYRNKFSFKLYVYMCFRWDLLGDIYSWHSRVCLNENFVDLDPSLSATDVSTRMEIRMPCVNHKKHQRWHTFFPGKAAYVVYVSRELYFCVIYWFNIWFNLLKIDSNN